MMILVFEERIIIDVNTAKCLHTLDECLAPLEWGLALFTSIHVVYVRFVEKS